MQKIWDSMRTLYWIDTLNKDMDEIHKITDTGFCNRIVTWEILQFLNERNGFLIIFFKIFILLY